MMTWLKAGVTGTQARVSKAWGGFTEALVAVFEIPVIVTTLHGPLRGGAAGDEATLLYVGRHYNLPHIKKKFFKEVTTLQDSRSSLLTFRKHLENPDADIIFVDIGRPYNGLVPARESYLDLPDWVCMVAPIAGTWEATVQNFRKTMRKNIRRLIRKNDYRCEPTNDPAFIAAFYEDFYKPFIESRHVGEAYLTSRLQIEKYARQGTILQVMGPDGPVAAGVYFSHGDHLYLLDAGMPAALVAQPAEASMAALYYFSLHYAFENGLKGVNFMGTRAFPDDGLFQFKRKWGAVIKDDFSTGSIFFKPANTPRAARFCELFPLVARKGKDLELVLCATAPELDPDAIDRLVAASHCDGLDPVRVVHLTDQPQGPRPPLDESPKVTCTRTPLETFTQTYTEPRNPAR